MGKLTESETLKLRESIKHLTNAVKSEHEGNPETFKKLYEQWVNNIRGGVGEFAKTRDCLDDKSDSTNSLKNKKEPHKVNPSKLRLIYFTDVDTLLEIKRKKHTRSKSKSVIQAAFKLIDNCFGIKGGNSIKDVKSLQDEECIFCEHDFNINFSEFVSLAKKTRSSSAIGKRDDNKSVLSALNKLCLAFKNKISDLATYKNHVKTIIKDKSNSNTKTEDNMKFDEVKVQVETTESNRDSENNGKSDKTKTPCETSEFSEKTENKIPKEAKTDNSPTKIKGVFTSKKSKTTDDLILKKWELNKVQKLIIATFFDKDIDSLTDWGDINEIRDNKKSLEDYFTGNKLLKQPYKLKYLQEGFEELNLSWNTSGKNEGIRLVKIEGGKLLNLIKEYLNYIKQRKNVEEFLKKVLEELKGIEDKTTFERVAAEYGCMAEGDLGYAEFNSFLRKKFRSNINLTILTPKEYAHFFYKVDTLRKGIRQNNYLINKEITLYRYSKCDSILSMLKDAHIISQKDFYKLYNRASSFECADHEKVYEVISGLINEKKPIIRDLGFLSTSKSSTATDDFGSVKFIIKVKPGTATAADISNLSGHKEQQEVLFLPEQKFRALKAQYKGTELQPGFIWYSIEIEMETIK